MVKMVVNPEGSPGPGDRVYVTTWTDAVEGFVFPDGPEPATDGVPAEDPGTVTVRGCGDGPASEEPYVETVGWEPPDRLLCGAGPETVRVSTPVDPEGSLGPGGTVYVRTSTVGLDEAEEEPPAPLAPEPGTVTVMTCEEAPDTDPGTVTVRG